MHFNMRVLITRPALLFLLMASLVTETHAELVAAVIYNTYSQRSSLLPLLDQRLPLNSFTEPIRISWIQANSNSSSVGRLTSNFATYGGISVIIGTSGSCSTQLELAAAWSTPIFTYSCPEDDTLHLRQTTLYNSHIRLDYTQYSLVPFINAFLKLKADSQDRSLALFTSPQSWQNVALGILQEFRTAGFETLLCKVCEPTNQHNEKGASSFQKVLIGEGTPAEGLVLLVDQYSILPLLKSQLKPSNITWSYVLLAAYQKLPIHQVVRIEEYLSGFTYSNNIYLLQPSVDDPTNSMEFMKHKVLSAYELFMKLRREYSNHGPDILSDESDRRNYYVKQVANRCFDEDFTGIKRKMLCFDGRAWALPSFNLFHFGQPRCQHPGFQTKSSFYKYGAFFKTLLSNWNVYETECNDSSPLITARFADSKDLADRDLYILVGLVCTLVITIIVIIVTVICCRRKRKRADTRSWMLSGKDVQLFCDNETEETPADLVSIYSQDPRFMTDSQKSASNQRNNFKSDENAESRRTDFGYFKGTPVTLKKYNSSQLLKADIDSVTQAQLSTMVQLRHENLATFYGVYNEDSELILVSQYCLKGSLEEIFLFEPFHIDEIFIASLVNDIVKGMIYLHKHLGPHGNLKSSNCIVTSRWVVKLSDFGLTPLRRSKNDHAYSKDMLWSSPEVLSNLVEATQKADVYSFGIILYEMIGKQGPFGTGYHFEQQELQDILDKIRTKSYHPDTSWICCEDFLKNCMLTCWQLKPNLRPDFNSLSQQLRPFRAVLLDLPVCHSLIEGIYRGGRSIVDNMLVIMERYQMRLEDLVQERTVQLEAEKKRTVNLLHRMLPPQVADQLLIGRNVAPESFRCISVLFADICEFTSLASTATPIQVIQLLNELYTLFDSIISDHDVYKVETVGDAYLCVSGLPKPNGDRHASEICIMALEFLRELNFFKSLTSISQIEDSPLLMRIGINSGPCVAGVVGLEMPRYTLFGDTINVASRLETTSEPMRIQIGESTKKLLDSAGGFKYTARGSVHLKGKGDVATYWLESCEVTESKQTQTILTPRTLQVAGLCGSSSRSSISSNISVDLLRPEVSRNGSMRSEVSIKSDPVFKRTSSFRQQVKCASLSSPYPSSSSPTPSPKTVRRKSTNPSHSDIKITSCNKETTKLLIGNHHQNISQDSPFKPVSAPPLANIIIQVDHVE